MLTAYGNLAGDRIQKTRSNRVW